MKVNKLFLLALFPFVCFAQEVYKTDTSYTIYSTYKKLVKNYPLISPAENNLPPFLKSTNFPPGASVAYKKDTIIINVYNNNDFSTKSIDVYKKDPIIINAEFNIVYKKYDRTDYKKELRLDLFKLKYGPPDALPGQSRFGIPLIILVHGGGWSSGNKEMEYYPAVKLVEKGYAVAAVEYTLSSNGLYPDALKDIVDAVKFLANKYNWINKNNVFLYGESAGGQLVSLVGTKYPDICKAVINVDGVLDMTTPEESGKDTIPGKMSAGRKWLGFTYKEKPSLWKEASAINYADSLSPSFLFINSSIPRFHAGRDLFIKKLNKYNIYSEVHTIRSSPHSFWFFNPWADEMINNINLFIKKSLTP